MLILKQFCHSFSLAYKNSHIGKKNHISNRFQEVYPSTLEATLSKAPQSRELPEVHKPGIDSKYGPVWVNMKRLTVVRFQSNYLPVVVNHPYPLLVVISDADFDIQPC